MEVVNVVETTKEVVEATKPLMKVVASFETLEARKILEGVVEPAETMEGVEANDPIQVVSNYAQIVYLYYSKKDKIIVKDLGVIARKMDLILSSSKEGKTVFKKRVRRKA